jgi:hypothetical protein
MNEKEEKDAPVTINEILLVIFVTMSIAIFAVGKLGPLKDSVDNIILLRGDLYQVALLMIVTCILITVKK